MGSSLFAALAFKYMGFDIYPEMASEFYNYLQKGKKYPNGVLLSQSGRSTEVLWCAELFEIYSHYQYGQQPVNKVCSSK